MRHAIFVLALLFLARPGEAADNSLVAYSLNAAERMVKSGGRDPEIANLAKITRLMGLMYDRQRRDVVVIGRAEEGRPTLSLSDFVVALRAVILLEQWPLVSIDPTP